MKPPAMLNKLLPFIVMVIFLPGCASDLKREVHNLEYEIQRSSDHIDDAKTSLAKNTDVYDGQNCIEPERGTEPKFSCHTAQ
jgi:hypothetical protein